MEDNVVKLTTLSSNCSIIYEAIYSDEQKTLCEILTAADAMPPSMASSEVDGNLSWHGSVRPPLQQRGSRVAPMWAGSDPNAMPSAIYRCFPGVSVSRQVPLTDLPWSHAIL